MAEIVSAIPTSGGPYFWSAMLAPPSWSPFLAWLTGWFNLLGQVAVTTGITFGLAGLISTAITVKSPDYEQTAAKTIGIYAALLVSHGVVNTFGVKGLRLLNNVSIVLHSAGITALCIAVLAKAPKLQSAKFVFGTYHDGTAAEEGVEGWGQRASPAYVVLCGALLSQYTLTGFDASAHLSEETKKASWSAPIGVVSSVGFSSLFGFFVLMAFLFSIQDFERVLDSRYGQPVLQIFVDVAGEDGALVLFSLIMVCVWHCGLFSMTSNSRMMFAFARDRGIVSLSSFSHYPLSSTFSTSLLWPNMYNTDRNSPHSSTKSTPASSPPSAPSGSPPSSLSFSPSPLSGPKSPSQPPPPSPPSVSTFPTACPSSSGSSGTRILPP